MDFIFRYFIICYSHADSCLLCVDVCLYTYFYVDIKSMWHPLIQDCYSYAFAILAKIFVIRSFFCKKWLLTHIFCVSKDNKFSCKQACIEFLYFWHLYHTVLLQHRFHIVYTAFGLDKLLFLCFNHHYKLWKEEVNQRFTYRD